MPYHPLPIKQPATSPVSPPAALNPPREKRQASSRQAPPQPAIRKAHKDPTLHPAARDQAKEGPYDAPNRSERATACRAASAGGGWCRRYGWVVAGQQAEDAVGGLAALRVGLQCCWAVVYRRGKRERRHPARVGGAGSAGGGWRWGGRVPRVAGSAGAGCDELTTIWGVHLVGSAGGQSQARKRCCRGWGV